MVNFFQDLSILDKKDLVRFYFIIFLSLIGTFLEIVGIGLIVPFVIIITDPNVFENNLYLKQFSNFFGIESRDNLILFSIIILLIIYFIKLTFLTYLSWVKNVFSYRIQSDISAKIFKIFLQQPYIYFSNVNSSKLIQETKDEPSIYASGIIIGRIDMLSEVLIILGISILLLTYNFIPSLIIFFFIVIILFSYKSIFKKSALKWALEKKYFQILGYNILKYVYNSIIEVKIANKEKIVLNKFADYSTKGNYYLTKQMFMLDVPRLFLEFIAVFLFLLFVLSAFSYYENFNQLIPSIALFSVSAFKILPSVNRIIIGIQKINFSKNSYNVIKNLYEKEAKEIIDDYNSSISFDRKLELKNINFQYEKSKKILENIDFSINFGEIIGLKGLSGAGKTTLVNLMLGLLYPNDGQILIDDQNLKHNERKWQKIVSYATQRTYIIDDTIKKNICFEEEVSKIDDEQLKEVLKLSSLEDYVNDLENKADSLIGENGSQLSGGQIQRIGFARAIYRKPKFLVLDEITSSLDKTTERKILDSIKKLSKNMTILLISHRDEPLDICDRVFEIKDGKLEQKD